jgi:hypothetical protein
MAPRRLTRLGDQLDGWRLGSSEVIRWISRDGAEIEGVLRKPSGWKPAHRAPLIVVIHGGPTATSRPSLFGATYVYPIEQWLEQEKRVLSVGDSVVIPASAVHATFNDGAWPKAKVIAAYGKGPWGRIDTQQGTTIGYAVADIFHGTCTVPADLDLAKARVYLVLDEPAPEAASAFLSPADLAPFFPWSVA